MLYAEICPKVRRHNALTSGHALCLLTLGQISAYNMDNTILLYNYHPPSSQWFDTDMVFKIYSSLKCIIPKYCHNH